MFASVILGISAALTSIPFVAIKIEYHQKKKYFKVRPKTKAFVDEINKRRIDEIDFYNNNIADVKRRIDSISKNLKYLPVDSEQYIKINKDIDDIKSELVNNWKVYEDMHWNNVKWAKNSKEDILHELVQIDMKDVMIQDIAEIITDFEKEISF